MKEEEIIAPVAKDVLLSELTKEKFVRVTNKGENEIYIITHNDSPNIMREIGRLREVTFRAAGGGTGLSIDLDDYDTAEEPYQQLVVWSPEDKEFVGGYRFIKCGEVPIKNGVVDLATTHLFNFSEKFIKEYLPYTIELGRSFVQPMFQPSLENRKGLFSLDNLWDGLGAVIVDNPDIKYYFGKVTMYTHYNVEARDMILTFMDYYFPDPDKMVTPISSLPITTDIAPFLESIKGQPYKEGHRILNKNVRDRGEQIPPLVNSYMNISSTMKSFRTANNADFGDVEESGILVTIADMYPSKVGRHMDSYIKAK